MVPQGVIGGMFRRSPCVSHAGPNHARDTPEPGVRSPESAQGKRGRLCPGGDRGIHGRAGSRARPTRFRVRSCPRFMSQLSCGLLGIASLRKERESRVHDQDLKKKRPPYHGAISRDPPNMTCCSASIRGIHLRSPFAQRIMVNGRG